MKTLGIILIVMGSIMTMVTGFTIVTQEKVVNIGPIEINEAEKTPIYWSPITGGIIIIVGVFVLFVNRKNIK